MIHLLIHHDCLTSPRTGGGNLLHKKGIETTACEFLGEAAACLFTCCLNFVAEFLLLLLTNWFVTIFPI